MAEMSILIWKMWTSSRDRSVAQKWAEISTPKLKWVSWFCMALRQVRCLPIYATILWNIQYLLSEYKGHNGLSPNLVLVLLISMLSCWCFLMGLCFKWKIRIFLAFDKYRRHTNFCIKHIKCKQPAIRTIAAIRADDFCYDRGIGGFQPTCQHDYKKKECFESV